MAKGPLRTFFRENAGFDEDQPDLTDYLLDSMISQGAQPRRVTPSGQVIPTPTSMARATVRRGPFGVPIPQLSMPPEGDVTVKGSPYPAMPGPPPAPAAMPQMRKPGWAEFLSMAGGGIADAFNARAGRRSDWFGRISGMEQAQRDREYQLALAERSALEQAARLAHQYDWQRYNAGQQERRFDQQVEDKAAERKLYEQLIGKQQEDAQRQAEFQKHIMGLHAAERFKDVGTLADLKDKMSQGALTARTPEELAALQMAAEAAGKPLRDNMLRQNKSDVFEREVEQEVRRLVLEHMAKDPSSGHGFGGLGLSYQYRKQAEENVRRRRPELK